MDKALFVYNMLFAVAAPPDVTIESQQESRASHRKRSGRQTANLPGRMTIYYAIKDIKVGRSAFTAVVQLSEATIRRHALQVAAYTVPAICNTNHSTTRKGKFGLQKTDVEAFLKSLASLHALECSRGRGSAE